jgi:hypothetical protein
MFKITTWTSKKRTLDFTSSGQKNIDVLSIYIGYDVLCNAYELFEWDKEEDNAQFQVCEACGIIHCNPGGWATFRKVSDIVMIIPLFNKILSDDDFERSEFTPPNIIRKRGVMYFDVEKYQRFHLDFPKFPNYESIPILKQNEALYSIQHDAPGRFLGDIYKSTKPNTRQSLVIAASDGNTEDFSKILLNIFNNPFDCCDPAKISKPTEDDIIITLYIDLPQIPEWRAFWMGKKTIGLYFSPQHKLEVNCNSEQ